MQLIVETAFTTLYLVTILMIGMQMIRTSKHSYYFFLFGVMAMLLGISNLAYFIPRIYSLFQGDVQATQLVLEVGKMLASIAFTLFYFLLYEALCLRFKRKRSAERGFFYLLGIIYIILSITSYLNVQIADFSNLYMLLQGVLKLLIGGILVGICYWNSRLYHDRNGSLMAVCIFFSCFFYIGISFLVKYQVMEGFAMMFSAVANIVLVYIAYQELRISSV